MVLPYIEGVLTTGALRRFHNRDMDGLLHQEHRVLYQQEHEGLKQQECGVQSRGRGGGYYFPVLNLINGCMSNDWPVN